MNNVQDLQDLAQMPVPEEFVGEPRLYGAVLRQILRHLLMPEGLRARTRAAEQLDPVRGAGVKRWSLDAVPASRQVHGQAVEVVDGPPLRGVQSPDDEETPIGVPAPLLQAPSRQAMEPSITVQQRLGPSEEAELQELLAWGRGGPRHRWHAIAVAREYQARVRRLATVANCLEPLRPCSGLFDLIGPRPPKEMLGDAAWDSLVIPASSCSFAGFSLIRWSSSPRQPVKHSQQLLVGHPLWRGEADREQVAAIAPLHCRVFAAVVAVLLCLEVGSDVIFRQPEDVGESAELW